jgi:hypothetical protein
MTIKGAGARGRRQDVVIFCPCGQPFQPCYGDVRIFCSRACANRDIPKRRSAEEQRRRMKRAWRVSAKRRRQAHHRRIRSLFRSQSWRRAYKAIYQEGYRAGLRRQVRARQETTKKVII